MTLIIILGHGKYASGLKSNLAMLLGDLEHFKYVDFLIDDSKEKLNEKIDKAINNHEGDILFVCDLAGGTPFREACLRKVENPSYEVIAGVNTAGIAEIAYLDEPASVLADLAVNAGKEATIKFEIWYYQLILNLSQFI